MLMLLLAATLSIDPVYVTFDTPVQVPGAVLPAGSYILAADASIGGQTVIDVYTTREPALVASMLALERARRPDEGAGMTMYEGTSPRALRDWMPAYARRGYTLVYSHREAREIFRASGVRVPATVFAGSLRSLLGVIPVADIDRAGEETPWIVSSGDPESPAPGPLDHLRLARLSIVRHLAALPGDLRTRFRLVDRQVLDVMESYRERRADLLHRTLLLVASIDNMPPVTDEETLHVIERVRARVKAFVAFTRTDGRGRPLP